MQLTTRPSASADRMRRWPPLLKSDHVPHFLLDTEKHTHNKEKMVIPPGEGRVQRDLWVTISS